MHADRADEHLDIRRAAPEQRLRQYIGQAEKEAGKEEELHKEATELEGEAAHLPENGTIDTGVRVIDASNVDAFSKELSEVMSGK